MFSGLRQIAVGDYGNPVFCWPGFSERDARSACRGATCYKPRSDFRVQRRAMVGVGFGV